MRPRGSRSSRRWDRSRQSTTSISPPKARSRAPTPTEPSASTPRRRGKVTSWTPRSRELLPWTPRSSPSPRIPTVPSRPSRGSAKTLWSSAANRTRRSRCGNSARATWRAPSWSRRSRCPATCTTSAAWRTPTPGSCSSPTFESRACTPCTSRRGRLVSTTSLSFPSPCRSCRSPRSRRATTPARCSCTACRRRRSSSTRCTSTGADLWVPKATRANT